MDEDRRRNQICGFSGRQLTAKKLSQSAANFLGSCVNHFRMTAALGDSLAASAGTGSHAATLPIEMPVSDAYDALAHHYRSYSESRSSYLRKVEEVIIGQTGAAASVLDVGAGDGVRSLRIARSVGASRLVLVEPSPAMRAMCPQYAEIWPCQAKEIPSCASQFDLIVCLWNVLGHIQTSQDRLLTLSRMKELAAPGATIFLDVNHRHNAAAYGWRKTFFRMVRDFFVPSDTNGDVPVSWQVGGRTLRTQGHVFTRKEMQRLFRSAGLKVMRRWAINYETGADCRLPFFGQLLYQLAAA